MGRIMNPRDMRLRITQERTVSFTPQKLERFRDAYDECRNDKERIFEFEGDHYLTGYAKYMIEYMEGLWVADDTGRGKAHD